MNSISVNHTRQWVLRMLCLASLSLSAACTSNRAEDPIPMSDSPKPGATLVSNEAGTTAKAGWAVGDKVGLYVKANNSIMGPLPFTISNTSSGSIQFAEALPIIDYYSEHTFYAYFPYEANTSSNPETVNTLRIPANQTQDGMNSNDHLLNFYIGQPTSIYAGENLQLYFMSILTMFEYQINTNIDGLVVNSIKCTAPEGKILSYTSANVNITLGTNNPNFGVLSGFTGGNNSVSLNINGGLPVPNSTVTYSVGKITVAPFNARGQKLTVTVDTNHGEFTLEFDGDNYNIGTYYVFPLRIEANEPEVLNDINVLSVSEVGCLGEYDNTKPWNADYGATDHAIHARGVRRILFEHFGENKTIPTGKITFHKTDINCNMNSLDENVLAQYDIIFLNNNARPNEATSQAVMNWLNSSPNKVLLLGFDWKDPHVDPHTSEPYVQTTTNYILFRDHITGFEPHWYNNDDNREIGNYGPSRLAMFLPVEINERTAYFWKNGPFPTDWTEASEPKFWVEGPRWGSGDITSSNLVPLVTYRGAIKDNGSGLPHPDGNGDYGTLLAVDPVNRIVYLGTSEAFSSKAYTEEQKAARVTFNADGTMNNYAKMVANIWAWMIQEVVYKK